MIVHPDLVGGAVWGITRADKIARNPATGGAISVSADDGWMPLAEAVLYLRPGETLTRRMLREERLLCVDVDDMARVSVPDWSLRFEAEGWVLGTGWRTTSPSGTGEHIWFRLPPDVDMDQLATALSGAGVECYTHSRHIRCAARDGSGALDLAPPELLARLHRPKRDAGEHMPALPLDRLTDLVAKLDKVPFGAGARNAWLSRLWAIRAAAADEDMEAAEAMAFAWSVVDGQAPDVADFRRAWEDGAGRDDTGAHQLLAFCGELRAVEAETARRAMVEAMRAAPAPAAPPPPEPEADLPLDAEAIARRYGLLDIRALPAMETPDALIPETIPTSGVGVLAAPSNMGKSVWALDMAAAVGDGRVWDEDLGMGAADACSLYMAYEDGWRFAHQRARGVGLQYPTAEHSGFRVAHEDLPSLLDPDIIQKLRLRVAALRIVTGRRGPCLVVCDTLAAAAAGLDENDNSKVGALLATLAGVTDRSDPAVGEVFVLLVHHYGKDASQGLRGASAWYAGTDAVLRVWVTDVLAANESGGERKAKIVGRAGHLTRTKIKGMGGDMTTTTRTVGLIDLGMVDRNGKPVQSPILLPKPGRAAGEAAREVVEQKADAAMANFAALAAMVEAGDPVTAAIAAKAATRAEARTKDLPNSPAEARAMGDAKAARFIRALASSFPGATAGYAFRATETGDDGATAFGLAEDLNGRGNGRRLFDYAVDRGLLAIAGETLQPGETWTKTLLTREHVTWQFSDAAIGLVEVKPDA